MEVGFKSKKNITTFRDEQTSVADAIDPETKATEKSINSFFREKIKQLSIDLRFAKGETSYYKDEVNRSKRMFVRRFHSV